MSDDDMVVRKQNKVKINATVSKWTKTKSEEYAATEDYSSFSNFVETALNYYMGAIEKERDLKLKEAEDLLMSRQQEGKELVTVILQLISNHPELLPEYNDLRKKQPSSCDNIKKVTFE